MPQRRSTTKASKPRMAKSLPSPVVTYEEILLKGVMDGKNHGSETEFSIILTSVLSTLTQGLSNAYYSSGVSAGKLLYRICNGRRHYTLHEEGVSDLVSFFESAGYPNIMYNVYPDRIDIKFSRRPSPQLGRTAHLFEAGLMSGFLSEAKGTDITFEELACVSKGSSSCHFVSREGSHESKHGHRYEAIDMFAESIGPYLHLKGLKGGGFSEEYLALSSNVLYGLEYSNYINQIAFHLGKRVASGLTIKPTSRSLKQAEALYKLLGLGDMRVKSPKPLKIEVRFDRLKAKKEFVDISIAFLNGLLADSVNGSISGTTKAQRNGSYIVNVTSGNGV